MQNLILQEDGFRDCQEGLGNSAYTPPIPLTQYKAGVQCQEDLARRFLFF